GTTAPRTAAYSSPKKYSTLSLQLAANSQVVTKNHLQRHQFGCALGWGCPLAASEVAGECAHRVVTARDRAGSLADRAAIPTGHGANEFAPLTAVTTFQSPRTCSSATSSPTRRTRCGSPTSRMSRLI